LELPHPGTINPRGDPTMPAAADVVERTEHPAAAIVVHRAGAVTDPASPPTQAVKRDPALKTAPSVAPAPGQPRRKEAVLPVAVETVPAPRIPESRTVEEAVGRRSARTVDAQEGPSRQAPPAPIRLEPAAVVPPVRPADEPTRSGVRIGSLEVRIVSPPQAGQPPVVPAPVARPSPRQTAPLSRGFRSFGLAQG
jgi:hypothetical protein